MGAAEKSVAVILAGGVGQRFGGDIPKQYVELQGVPIVMHSALTFDAMKAFDALVLVARREEFGRLGEMVETAGLDSCVEMVEGGESRSESSYRAVESLGIYEDTTGVLIHDAARPLMTEALAWRMLEALNRFKAALPVVRSTDAIVEVQNSGTCAARRPRDAYRLVQTPQAFRLGVLRRAYGEAFRRGAGSWDDDATVVSTFVSGVEVACVEGEVENFKVTRREDVLLAEQVLSKRGRGGEA